MAEKKSVKEGLLLKQTSSFQRWKRRYFKLRGRTLYYAKDAKSLIFDEVDLSDASVAESSTKNINNSFTVITPFRKLILCAENRKEMEDWIGALKSVQKWEIHEATQFNMEHFSGMHNWYACSHARPTFCNVCREALSGVTSHGLSCEVCKFKAHKRCAVRATNNCKWTTLASIGTEIIEDEDGVAMPHQWLEGNLPVSARCAVCDRACGSVRRLQDWRCLWCKAIVHSACKELFGKRCPLGQYKVSIIPPTALNSIDSDGFWKATCPSTCSSPLLAFVNSKSGDNQGVKFLRKFKQFLNPAQVFDLMNGGPHLGLRLFQKFSTFRILVCGGDGSVGWVLSEIDALGLHKQVSPPLPPSHHHHHHRSHPHPPPGGTQGCSGWAQGLSPPVPVPQCQLGVLPLGTGNDLARVLGWGSLCDDDTQLLQILEKLERATTKMLDRWSVMTYEAPKQSPPALKEEEDGDSNIQVGTFGDGGALGGMWGRRRWHEVSVAGLSLATCPRPAAKRGGPRCSDEAVSWLGDTRPGVPARAVPCQAQISHYADSVAFHLAKILESDKHSVVISSAKFLCGTVNDFVAEVGRAYKRATENKQEAELMARKCAMLNEKLDSLVRELSEEAQAAVVPEGMPQAGPADAKELEKGGFNPSPVPRIFKSKEQLMLRANSLKKALRQIIEQAEKGEGAARGPCLGFPDRILSLAAALRGPGGASPLLRGISPVPGTVPNAVGWGAAFGMWGGCPGLAARLRVCTQLWTSRTSRPKPTVPAQPPARRTARRSSTRRRGSVRHPTWLFFWGGDNGESRGMGSFSSNPPWPGSRRETVSSATSSILLERPDTFGSLQFPEEPSVLHFSEKCVMNNYFGIGLDAKISLEFNNKRDEHPKKCRLAATPPPPGGKIRWEGPLGCWRAPLGCQRGSTRVLEGAAGMPGGAGGSKGGAGGSRGSLVAPLSPPAAPRSSRTKNMMWYGVLGTKELLQRTYKNLEQRVQLECDGVPISLPSLQGIAVLNIPSYAGGINFWGGTKEDNNFGAPSFDDKKLEVVAVFGSIQMAVSRVINLQHHRIAQCRVVKITIRGDEGVPVQVDGEAWIQPPGVIKIQHKNRAQMLTRDRAFESTLKSWEDKQKGESYRAAARPRLSSQQSMEYLTEEESSLLQQLSRAAESLIARIHEAAKAHKAVEQELAHAVNTSALALSEALSNKAAGAAEFLSRNAAVEVVLSIKALYAETRAFLEGKAVSEGPGTPPSPPAGGSGAGDGPCPPQLDSPQEEEALQGPLSALGQELQRLLDIHWLVPIAHPAEEESGGSANKGSFKLRLNIPKPRKDKAQKQKANSALPADKWGAEEVAAWLEALGLGEYRDIFIRHDIQGSELILLERRDLKDLGITKVGHMKRILQAIKELSNPP
ncbi:Diacylglycerol kinase kappa isoform X1 [Aix galericulata]|nr:Diacylglycerol kinase kappa isoform X1 [Aix galericulata]